MKWKREKNLIPASSYIIINVDTSSSASRKREINNTLFRTTLPKLFGVYWETLLDEEIKNGKVNSYLYE